ncbi:MAG: hypothetical protein MIN69_08935 [Methylorubrum extorquens]|jgi:hypothetical protein|uniref:hypothetical protein n=1 Tax=Methylorubrum extorquens TaxID=408 RepID=UPI002FEE4BB3
MQLGLTMFVLWLLAIGLPSIGSGLIYSAIGEHRHDPGSVMIGTAQILTGAAIYRHNLRSQ